MRSIVFWLQKKYMLIVELNWFSGAFILNLHSLWMPIWAIRRMLKGQLSLNANAAWAAFAAERAPGETSICNWITWATFLLVQTSFPYICFSVLPFQTCFYQQLELKGIPFLANMVLQGLCSLTVFMLCIWIVHMWGEGLPHLSKTLWLICVIILLGILFGFWVGKDITHLFIWSK